jgi:tyrosyl-tRNA synthetase
VYSLGREVLEKGITAYLLFEQVGLCKTRSEARRLISQGGGYVNEERIATFDQVIDLRNLDNGSLLLRAGKKRYKKITTG